MLCVRRHWSTRYEANVYCSCRVVMCLTKPASTSTFVNSKPRSAQHATQRWALIPAEEAISISVRLAVADVTESMLTACRENCSIGAKRGAAKRQPKPKPTEHPEHTDAMGQSVHDALREWPDTRPFSQRQRCFSAVRTLTPRTTKRQQP